MKALGLPREVRRRLTAIPADDIAFTIRIGGKPERCISHAMARGLIDSYSITRLRSEGEIEAANAINADIATAPAAGAYAEASSSAMGILTQGMTPQDTVVFMMEAFKAEQGGAHG